VYIDCMDNPRNPGNYLYALNFEVSVSDADGVPTNINSVTVTYPDNSTKRELRSHRQLKHDSENDVDYYFYYYYYREVMALDSIQAGNYTFTVTDRDNKTATVADTLTKNPILPAKNLSPASGAVVGTRPTFTWDAVTGASYYFVDHYENWSGQAERSVMLTTNTVTPTNDQRLDSSKTYGYTVIAYREASGEDLDNRSLSDYRSLTERTHFFTSTGGDVNGDSDVLGLADAIVALKVVARMKPTVYKDADVNGDKKIGLPEAIYILQVLAGLRL
jgi:hypothetical protein